MPLYILFIGYPEKFDNLILQDMPFGRIFHYEELNNLENSDVSDFFNNTFEITGIKCEKDALDILVLFSQGSPLMMQYIGDEVFRKTDSEIITKNIAGKGVLNAANELGNNEIRPILNCIGSKNYRNILIKLGKNHMDSFKESDLKELLSDEESNILDDF